MLLCRFDLSPIERSEPRLNTLLKLLKRKDVTGLVNACDAGREGELIFAWIMQHAGNLPEAASDRSALAVFLKDKPADCS